MEKDEAEVSENFVFIISGWLSGILDSIPLPIIPLPIRNRQGNVWQRNKAWTAATAEPRPGNRRFLWSAMA